VGGNATWVQTHGQPGSGQLDLVGHRDPSSDWFDFLIFFFLMGLAPVGLIFFFFLMGFALDLVFHMAPITFRVIKSQKRLTFPSRF
jgi:hypothetical protein